MAVVALQTHDEGAELLGLLRGWAEAVGSGDVTRVTRLYAEDAVLVATFDEEIKRNPNGIRDYFTRFLARRPCVTFEEGEQEGHVHGEMAILSGAYHFVLEDGIHVSARYTFAYAKEGGRWIIIQHHSSRIPIR